jgi:hypothetical protein
MKIKISPRILALRCFEGLVLLMTAESMPTFRSCREIHNRNGGSKQCRSH